MGVNYLAGPYTVPVYENLHPPRWFSTRRPSRGSGRYSPPAQKSQTEIEKVRLK